MNTQTRVWAYALAALLSLSLVGTLRSGPDERTTDGRPAAGAHASQSAEPAILAAATATPVPAMATDPSSMPRAGMERYDRSIHDYACVLLKQERIDGRLKEPEIIEVRYRENPRTVYMIWHKNADKAKRALFMDTAEFRNSEGGKQALVEPAGVIARLFVSEIKIDIHGPDAKKASRRNIDDFGFRRTFELLDKFNKFATEQGVLDLRYEGTGQIDGRPTYVFARYLPYTGEGGVYPDAKLVIHIDEEWFLPTGVFSYADKDGKTLLGAYQFTQVRLNPGLTARDFEF